MMTTDVRTNTIAIFGAIFSLMYSSSVADISEFLNDQITSKRAEKRAYIYTPSKPDYPEISWDVGTADGSTAGSMT
jgi:hypothetical protein